MLELWVLLLLSFSIGRRFVALLPNVVQRNIGFYIAPILGLAALILVATLYGWFSAYKSTLTILSALFLFILFFIFEPKKKQFLKEYLQIIVFSLFCSVPVFAAVLHYQGYNPFTDIFTYLSQAQWLQDHAFSEKAVGSGYYPAATQVVLYQQSGSRMGASFFLGYVQSLFALRWSYYAYIPAVALAFVTGCLAVGGIIRQVVPLKRNLILLLALIPAFSMNGFVFGAEWGFYPQTFGLALAAGIAAMFPNVLMMTFRKNVSWLRSGLYALPPALCTAALLFAYNEPFPIFAAGMALFLLVTAFLYKNQLRSLLVFLIFYAAEILILINYEGIRIAKNLFQTLGIANGQHAIGWPVKWLPIQFIANGFGMKNYFENRDFISEYVFSLVLIFVLVALIRFMRAKPKRNLTILFLVCIDLILLLVFFKFRYFSPSPSPHEVGQTFLQFKISKYSTPFSISLLGLALAVFWYYQKQLRPLFLIGYLALIAVGFYWHLKPVVHNLQDNFIQEVDLRKNPFNRLLQLREAVAAIPKDEIIYIGVGAQHNKLRQMIAYALYDRKLAADYTDDSYIIGQLPKSDRIMSPYIASWVVLSKSSSYTNHKIEKEVGPLILQKKSFSYVTLEKTENGYSTKFDKKDSYNFVNHYIDFYFNRVATVKKIQLQFALTSRVAPRSFKIEVKSLSGKVLAKYTLPSVANEKIFQSPWITVIPDQFILHVETDKLLGKSSKNDDSVLAKFKIADVSVNLK